MQTSISNIFPVHIREKIKYLVVNEEFLEEIRLRIGQPMVFYYGAKEWTWNREKNKLVRNLDEGYVVTQTDLEEILTYLSKYSLYAFEEEVRQGFITIEGGHRVGLCGQVILEAGKIKNLQYIHFMNIRVAKEKKDCAKSMIPYILDMDSIYNTVILSPPGVGKTTYLRDLIRLLSNGNHLMHGLRVAVLDERSEIAASHLGVPQNDLGMRTDVMEGCKKVEGIEMVVRSMAPEIIAVDELGGEQDYFAVEQALYSGCHILSTIHAKSIGELSQKPYFEHWMNRGIFHRFILLEKTEGGERKFQIYDENQVRLC